MNDDDNPAESRLRAKDYSTSIRVVCALLEKDDYVFAARRSTVMSLPGKWEFPGGKIEAGETPEAALIRELWEELRTGIHIHGSLPSCSTMNNQNMNIELIPRIGSMTNHRYELLEHMEAGWFSVRDLQKLDWAEADIPVLNAYIELRYS